MKLWRRLAKKDEQGKRNGREIAYQLRMGEVFSKQTVKTYPLLDSLIQRAGIKFIMSKKEQGKLKEMIDQVSKTNEEQVNETK